MATVFEAEQISLKRRVALKILPPHLSFSHESVQKFHREAEAGGRQRHPGIVAVYAVGEFEGVHFIAQELVDEGLSLADKLAKVRELPELPKGYFRRTAALFLDVADALRHAHTMGVTHRDVKPSNILITEEGRPKVTDFGLAKIEDALSLSRTGDFVGTPFYMSPEQAVSRGFRIDHRTDVYSLGVTLYEALTLKRPFEGKTTHEVLRNIIFSEPLDPRKVSAHVPRDLAVICLKAMGKNANRRFQTMEEFAADLQRFLLGDVVLARPTGLGRRIVKRIRRHPVAAGAVALGILTLLVIAANAAWTYSQVLNERAKTAAVNEFLAGVFAAPDPDLDGKDLKVVDFLAKASQRAGEAFPDQPEIRASLHATIGNTYEALGDYQAAAGEYQRSLEILRPVSDEGHRAVLDCEFRLAGTLVGLGRYPEAQAILEKVVDLQRHARGEDDPKTIEGMRVLARAYWRAGDFAAGEETYGRMIAILEQSRPSGDPALVEAYHDKGCMHLKQKQYGAAEPLLAAALEGRRRILGRENTRTLQAMVNLALLYKLTDRTAQAAELYGEALEIQSRVLPADHPNRLQTMNNLAALRNSQGRHEQAAELYREVLDCRAGKWGDSHPETLDAKNNLPHSLAGGGDREQAEALLREIIATVDQNPDRRYGDKHHWINNLARLLMSDGRFGEAEPHCRRVFEERARLFGERHALTLDAGAQTAAVLRHNGKSAEAEQLARDCVAAAAEILPIDDLTRIELHSTYGLCLNARERYGDAAEQIRACFEGAAAGGRADAADYLKILITLYEKSGQPDKARELEARAPDVLGKKEK